MNDIFTEWFNESAENQSLTAQERLILEVTEAIYSRMESQGITKSELAEKLGIDISGFRFIEASDLEEAAEKGV